MTDTNVRQYKENFVLPVIVGPEEGAIDQNPNLLFLFPLPSYQL